MKARVICRDVTLTPIRIDNCVTNIQYSAGTVLHSYRELDS